MKSLKYILSVALCFLTISSSPILAQEEISVNNHTYLRTPFHETTEALRENANRSPKRKKKLSLESITQTDRDEDNIFRAGLISDIHGSLLNSRNIAREFSQRNLDAIIVAGDSTYFSKFGADPYNNPDDDDLAQSLLPLLQTNLPVFVIMGNHESVKTYIKTCEKFSKKYPNLFYNIATADLDDVNIILLGGGNTFNTLREGLLLSGLLKEGLLEKAAKSFTDKDPIFLITHTPQKYSRTDLIDTKSGFIATQDFEYKDTIYQAGEPIPGDRHFGEALLNKGYPVTKHQIKHGGNKKLAKRANVLEILFKFSGHYHGAFGAINADEKPVREGEWTPSLHFSAGPGLYGKAGIIEIRGIKAKIRNIWIKTMQKSNPEQTFISK